VLDREEVEFPLWNPRYSKIWRRGSAGGVAGRSPDKYLARFNEFMDAHRELFRTLEMPHCVVRTDEDPWKLWPVLAERKRLK